MKKSGFTLIELIITIAIMALIGIVISTNMLGLFSQEEDRDYEEFVKKIEDAACIYVETGFSSSERTSCRNNGCTISIQNLISKGYISDDLKDPSNGKKISDHPNSYQVKVSWIDNVKTCKLNG